MNSILEDILSYSKNMHLLYIEDNEQARVFTLELLSRFFGKITVAQEGEEGLEIFKRDKIDMIITDVNMPKMGGIEMSSKIRAMDPDVIIFALSAHNETAFKDTSYNAGVNEYLEKPLDIKQLIDILSTLAMAKRKKV